MIPEYIIIEDIQRRREKSWRPEPMQLPLYEPTQHTPPMPFNPDPSEDKPKHNGVIIIDMNIE